MTRSLALALALSTTLVAPALAQNNTSNQPMTAQPQTAAPAASSATGAQVQFITQAQTGQIRGSKLIGVNIYNNNDENIGEVNDIVFDRNGNIQAIVIGVGGFLGIGEKNVALPFKSIQWVDAPRAAAANANPPAPIGTGMANNAAGTAAPDTTGAVANGNVAMAPPMNRDYPDHGLLNMSKDQLKNAPKFLYLSDQK